jgi:putative alpha-1,2-mannosidase
MIKSLVLYCFCVLATQSLAQHRLVEKVNVFLGTSGDHGQLSPAASSPFSMVSIGPQTYPNTHTGYEHTAKEFMGFTHNRIEGVGCRGSGGNLLIKPFLVSEQDTLIKKSETASPGYYTVSFTNGIAATITVSDKSGIEKYSGTKGLSIDLRHALANGFRSEEHTIEGNSMSGSIVSGTTCKEGAYKLYYYLAIDVKANWRQMGQHTVIAELMNGITDATLRIGFSTVSKEEAKVNIAENSFTATLEKTSNDWNRLLNHIQVTGDKQEEELFYSLLYRALQSPFNISEKDGSYRANDGILQSSKSTMYNGWAIWDNYRTQLPLLSLAYPNYYQNMVNSIVELYKHGKQNWATQFEPSNTVRTEHAIVVLLDAYRKGYQVDFNSIRDSLKKETDNLNFETPDKALESSYDTWAFSEILAILKDGRAQLYKEKALQYKNYWNKDFKDLTRNDIDGYGARGMYQGTIWQYRWFVPYDMKGLIELCGGHDSYLQQLDKFFARDYYNAANETDIQAPYLYNMTSRPWQSQAMIHKYARDTVIQYYTDINYRGIDPMYGRVFNNRPEAFVKSMDDDSGAMSSWYIWAACGLSPACVGYPVYYLSVPLFETVRFQQPNDPPFTIRVQNYSIDTNMYISSVTLNGKLLDRNWVTQEEIRTGGELVIKASAIPNKNFGIRNQWITELK